jgi:DNA-binding IclR family transcriptional regulator
VDTPVQQPSLQVLERAFAILDLFTAERPEWTTTELARECSLPIPTAHRILVVLRRRDLVVRDERSKRFRLGPAALQLGERARVVLDLRAVARPVLRRLARETDETALLTVLNDRRDRSVCLDRAESSQPLRLSIEPGRQSPLHAGASQKILFAYLSEEEIERILAEPLERLCRATITDPEALLANLAEIRERGWAISFEENNLGAWGVAVAILDEGGGLIGSLGLAGPSARLSRAEVVDQLRRLESGAAEIAASLGLPAPKVRLKGKWRQPPRPERNERSRAWR